MEPFILATRSDEGLVLADPTIVGLAWRLDELEQLEDDGEEWQSDEESYARGWRWCTSFSIFAPGGESGYLPDEHLLPLSQTELEQARADLGGGSEQSWRALDALFARALTRSV